MRLHKQFLVRTPAESVESELAKASLCQRLIGHMNPSEARTIAFYESERDFHLARAAELEKSNDPSTKGRTRSLHKG